MALKINLPTYKRDQKSPFIYSKLLDYFSGWCFKRHNPLIIFDSHYNKSCSNSAESPSALVLASFYYTVKISKIFTFRQNRTFYKSILQTFCHALEYVNNKSSCSKKTQEVAA